MTAVCPRRIDGVYQHPCGDQPVNRKSIRRLRHTTIRLLLTHRDPTPPIDLTQEPQPHALPHRDQHGKALTVQRMERVRDHQ
jgi:hypothetical protein